MPSLSWPGPLLQLALRGLISSVTVAMLTACGGSAFKGDDDFPTQLLSLDSSSEGGSTRFVALLLEPRPAVHSTGIVLLHGRGGNPDSAVVRELRRDLYARGYPTLSIQEPVPAGYSEGEGNAPPFSAYVNDIGSSNYVFPETYARVRTAINTLATRGMNKVVIIGFSMGSRMASAHVAHGRIDELPIVGLIGIGMYGNGIDPLNVVLTLGEVGIPVLDIYGSADPKAVKTAQARRDAYDRSGVGVSYRQIMLPCSTGLTENECHQLVGLNGSSAAPLESAVAAFISAL